MTDIFPKLVFLDWQDGDDELIRMKGWFRHNFVELKDGKRYQVCFLDNVRLGHELEANRRLGQPYFIEEALIVLTEVTVENMRSAVIQAEKTGFFERLRSQN